MPDVRPLIDVKEHEAFQGDALDVERVLIHARRFAKGVKDPNEPFANHQEAGEAADQLKAMKIVVDQVEGHRKEIKAPFYVTGQHIDSECKELLSQLRSAIEVLTKRGLAFKRQQDQIAREEEQRRREELQKREEEAATKAAEAAGKAESDPDDADAQREAAQARRQAAEAAQATASREGGEDAKPRQVRGSFASLGAVTDYKWDCYDVAALPPECTTENKKVIDAKVKAEKAMAKAEAREFNLKLIPGVRIWAEERGVSR